MEYRILIDGFYMGEKYSTLEQAEAALPAALRRSQYTACIEECPLS